MARYEYNLTPEELQTETWKDVVGYEEIYSVSNLGRVRRDKGGMGAKIGLILSQNVERNGYARVELWKSDEGRKFGVHQLVALAFIGPRPSRKTVNHKDGIKTNNRSGNLDYRTQKEQADHARGLGLLATGDRNGSRKYPERLRRGEAQTQSKLTEADVLLIRSAEGSQASIAARFLIHKSLVSLIKRRLKWKHLP